MKISKIKISLEKNRKIPDRRKEKVGKKFRAVITRAMALK
jgi:hypothetical protein